jgi:hypothetical protein
MKAILGLFTFVILQSVSFAGLETDIPSTNRVILASGNWIPASVDVHKCLIAIQSFLEHPEALDEYSRDDVKRILAHSREYRVQFVGVIRDGKKVIWCNCFLYLTTTVSVFRIGKRERLRWRMVAPGTGAFTMIQARTNVGNLNPMVLHKWSNKSLATPTNAAVFRCAVTPAACAALAPAPLGNGVGTACLSSKHWANIYESNL